MICDGKERFTTFPLAERVARLQSQRHKGSGRMHAYRCECGAYHVGSKVGGGKRDKVRGESYFTALARAD